MTRAAATGGLALCLGCLVYEGSRSLLFAEWGAVRGGLPQQGSLRGGALSDSRAEAGPRGFGAAAAAALAGCSVLSLAGLAAGARARRSTAAKAQQGEAEAAVQRRLVLLPGLLAATSLLADAAQAEEAPPEPVQVPPRINTDPYQIIGMVNPLDQREDQQVFYMHKQYRQDTEQVLNHMRICGSLDKGTPNMEKFNARVKEEMDDWLALYRRQDAVVGRMSYYRLYSAVNTLASHFTSYGAKFPFPNKRRPRFYELLFQSQKYLEKGK